MCATAAASRWRMRTCAAPSPMPRTGLMGTAAWWCARPAPNPSFASWARATTRRWSRKWSTASPKWWRRTPRELRLKSSCRFVAVAPPLWFAFNHFVDVFLVLRSRDHTPLAFDPRAISLRQYRLDIVDALPRRNRRFGGAPWHKFGRFCLCVVMHVARAIAEDFRHAHANDYLRFRIVWQQRIVIVDAGDALQPQSMRLLETNEQHADMPIPEQIAHRIKHAVAVITGKGDGLRVDRADESRVAALI